MRLSLFALATTAFLLGACAESSKTSTPAAPSTTVKASVGSPVTASGKARIALLLPLSGRTAPIGQSLQQAAEMSLFDTGAKELALAAYDSGESAETRGRSLPQGPYRRRGAGARSAVRQLGPGAGAAGRPRRRQGRVVLQ